MNPLFFFFLLLSLSSIAALSPDGLALLAFKLAVQEDPLSSLSAWNESDEDPCRWPGVSCFKSRVVSLSIPGKRLVGYIPSELGSLSSLRRLNLHSNSLSGFIPSQLSEAKSLRALYLYSNNLSGPVPSSLSDIPNIQIIDLSKNSLSGSIPPGFGHLPHLIALVLSDNHLSGEVPEELFAGMGGILRLDLSRNNLSGRIPPFHADLRSSLSRILNLSYNRLSGEIPKSLGSLSESVILDLRGNNLCGSPLENLCEHPSATSHGSLSHPVERESKSQRRGLTAEQIVAIAVADAVGVAVVAGGVIFACWRLRESGREEEKKSRRDVERESETCCLRSSCASTVAEGEGELVTLDKEFSFEIDELLKASAYVLGKSSGGIVYRVTLGEGQSVTVRRLEDGGAALLRRRDFMAAAQMISRVQHTNVVRLKAVYWSEDDKLLVSEFVPNGSLAGRVGQLPWKTRLKIARGVAKGLAHIHEWGNRKLVHGKIKLSNILLEEDWNPKIADLGLHRLVNGDSGTSGHQKEDVFSFGVVLMEMLTGRSIDLAVGPAELVRWVKKGFEDQLPLTELLDPAILPNVEDNKEEIVSVCNLALACTERNPLCRPKMKLASEFLHNRE